MQHRINRSDVPSQLKLLARPRADNRTQNFQTRGGINSGKIVFNIGLLFGLLILLHRP